MAAALVLALLAACQSGSQTDSAAKSGATSVTTPAPSITLQVTPETILLGQSATLSWSTHYATSCNAANGWSGARPLTGSASTGPLRATTEFDLVCTGGGGSARQSVIVTVNALAPLVQLTASPSTVEAGDTTTLAWTSVNATSCAATGGWSGAQPLLGSATSAHLNASTTYTLVCVGPAGGAAQSVTVTVIPPAPVIALTATPSTVVQGAEATLAWTTTNATACSASGSWSGAMPLSGTFTTGALSANARYSLNCTGPGGVATQSTTVSVVPPAPKLAFAATPSTIASGAAATLTWSATNAQSCAASGGWTGARATSGSASTGTLSASRTYTLACTGSGGTTTQAVTVTVSAHATAAPTVSLSVGPSVISAGSSATLTWASLNATSCAAAGGWSGTLPQSGTRSTGTLTATTTFTVSCTGAGGTATQAATVTVHPAAPAISLKASPSTVTSGGSATVTWNSLNATSCTASGTYNGSVPTSGARSTAPLGADATYTLTCTGSGGTAAQSVTVTVTPPLPSVTLKVNPSTLASGHAATLTWNSANTTACTASGAWSGARAINGTASTGALNANATYTLTCSGPGGSAAQSATVTLSAPPPTVSLAANPSTVAGGKSTTLTWSSTNATTCAASGGWSGNLSPGGSSVTAPLSASTTYGLTCTGPGGSASQTLVVTVANTTALGTAALSWMPPAKNVDGSTPVTPLAGYIVYYGTSTSALTNFVRIATPATTAYTVTGLDAGTWYFAVAAVAVDATVSPLSVIGSKTVTN